MAGYCRIACLFAIGTHLLQAGAANADLPPVSQVPVAERLWTVKIVHGGHQSSAAEHRRVTKVCGESPRLIGPVHTNWLACFAKNFTPVRYRIATLHGAPRESSPVVASVFEEKTWGIEGPGLAWTVELAAKPGVSIPWPDAAAYASDYGLHLAGVQRRDNWVRLLDSIPADGWMQITPSSDPPDHASIYIYVSPLESEIVELSALTASWPDGRRQPIEGGSYLIKKVTADHIEFREEIPSDFECGRPVTDPVPLPPTLRAPASQFFNEDATPRFSTKYTKGC